MPFRSKSSLIITPPTMDWLHFFALPATNFPTTTEYDTRRNRLTMKNPKIEALAHEPELGDLTGSMPDDLPAPRFMTYRTHGVSELQTLGYQVPILDTRQPISYTIQRSFQLPTPQIMFEEDYTALHQILARIKEPGRVEKNDMPMQIAPIWRWLMSK